MAISSAETALHWQDRSETQRALAALVVRTSGGGYAEVISIQQRRAEGAPDIARTVFSDGGTGIIPPSGSEQSPPPSENLN